MATTLILTLYLSAAPTAPPASETANNVICGPRCVRHVLEHYGRPAELVDLVRELQGAAIDRPASLFAMKRALERRGVHAAGARLPPADLPWLDWAEPVIVHVGETGAGVGHFLVVLRPNAQGDRIRVWDGLASDAWILRRELAATASGAVLLTSNTPFADDVVFVRRPWYVALRWRALILLLVAAYIAYAANSLCFPFSKLLAPFSQRRNR